MKKDNHAQKAVAVRYRIDQDAAPKVTAKGAGDIAKKIIEIAHENGVPLYEDSDLVELLAKVEVGESIPAQLYFVLAEVLAYIYRANKKTADLY